MENHPPTHRTTSNLYLVLIGLGLILAGLSAILLLGRPRTGVDQNAELLAVPAVVQYPAPDLSLKDLQGSPVSLADLRGKVVLVNLWATWCPPCKEEMPELQAFYSDHREEGFVIVAINDGDPSVDVTRFVEDYRLTFPVWLDPTYIATEKAFRAPGLPSSYLIDREGTIRLQWVGGVNAASLDKYVTPLLTE